MMLGNSKKAYNTLKALTKTQQHKSVVIEDSSGNILTESTAVLNRWTEHCNGLYNYELHPDTSLLQGNQSPTQEAESLPVPGEEVEEAMHDPRAEKSPGVDNIPSELLKNGGETNHNSPDSDMPEDIGNKGMAEGVGTIARHTFTIERSPQTM